MGLYRVGEARRGKKTNPHHGPWLVVCSNKCGTVRSSRLREMVGGQAERKGAASWRAAGPVWFQSGAARLVEPQASKRERDQDGCIGG